jgi:hypothetical protein
MEQGYLGKDCECGCPLTDGIDNRNGYNGNQCLNCRGICGMCFDDVKVETWVRLENGAVVLQTDENMQELLDKGILWEKDVCPSCGYVSLPLCTKCFEPMQLEDNVCRSCNTVVISYTDE